MSEKRQSKLEIESWALAEAKRVILKHLERAMADG
jgi:hypothetical protein